MNPAASPAAPGAPLVILDNLTVSYRQHPALHHITGVFTQGSLTAVMGPNGSGKSTLLKSVAGLLPIHDARATAALKVNLNRHQIAYLPQFSEIDRSFPINVHDCVLLGLWGSAGPLGGVNPAMLARVDAALHAVGLVGFERRSLGALSSGQFQRVLFARLLAQDADLILLDEPFNAMDMRTTADLLTLVQQWHQRRRTVIAVLHDEAQVRQHFPRTLLLARERVAWGPTAEVLTDSNLQRARTMAEAWDEAAPICPLDGVSEGVTITVRTQASSAALP